MDGGTDVRYHVRHAQHGLPVPFDPIILAFAAEAHVRPFTMEYTLHANELPEPVAGALHIRVARGRSSGK